MHERDSDNTMIFGTRAVIEALRAGKEFERIFVQRGINNPLLGELIGELKRAGLHYQLVPREKIDRLVRGNHQGVVAFLSEITYYRTEDIVSQLFEEGKTPLLLILDRITDTRNLGAIARTAEGSGVNAIIIPSRGSALISADAVKTSAGALHHLKVCREDNLKTVIDYLRDSGVRVVACTEKTSLLARNADLRGPLAVIMGSEENGVSPEYMKRCDELVKLPMQGEVSSFNVSVAAGMILYEVSCQRLIS